MDDWWLKDDCDMNDFNVGMAGDYTLALYLWFEKDIYEIPLCVLPTQLCCILQYGQGSARELIFTQGSLKDI